MHTLEHDYYYVEDCEEDECQLEVALRDLCHAIAFDVRHEADIIERA